MQYARVFPQLHKANNTFHYVYEAKVPLYKYPCTFYVKLNDDMISLKGEVRKMEQTIESFGAPNPDKRIKGKKYKDIYTDRLARHHQQKQ